MINVVDWETLGDKLSLPEHRLKEIHVDLFHKGNVRQKAAMLDLWFRYDTSASWEKLAKALEQMEEKVLADKIRKEYLS